MTRSSLKERLFRKTKLNEKQYNIKGHNNFGTSLSILDLLSGPEQLENRIFRGKRYKT